MSWSGPLRQVAPGIHEIPADYTGKDGTLRMRVPGRIVADPLLLAHIQDDMAPEQVANVASLPGIVGHSLAMPDIHWGYGFPIGGVAAFDPNEGGVVSPGGVGFDINCGVRLLRTGLTEKELRPRLPEVVDALFDAVPCGMGSKGGLELSDADLAGILDGGGQWAVENGWATEQDRQMMEDKGSIAGADSRQVHERARLRGKRSLGSLGSGNHFIELQVVDKTWDLDACKAYGVEPGQVLVMIHTGSRGLGHQICEDHVKDLQPMAARRGIQLPDRQLACAPLGTPEADRYLGAMAAAANFAFVNRCVITTLARRTLGRLFGAGPDGPDVSVLYDVCHNIAKMEEHTIPGTGRRAKVCVHRKGATRAFGPGHPDVPAPYRAVGQPVMVPGDMGRMSFLLAASPGAMTTSFGSCCHGAGRKMSRSQASRTWRGGELLRLLWERDGIRVRAATPEVAAEEAPEAYKDVSQVVDSVELAGLARKACRMRPVGVVKG
ncbi:MAG TPA: RtcB family protein [Candidatus Thermoplasmatota archaeon]|nr:RtcB family protein [Candidatus Thermoplasmatota archaeon]